MKAIVQEVYGSPDVLELKDIEKPPIKDNQVLGTFAECAAAAADDLVPKPANVTFEQAAAVPMAGLTALQALRDGGHLRPGQKVLINGAGGGIGTFAVQIAKSFGAEVTGVYSTTKVDLVRSIGADHVIDYTQEDFTRVMSTTTSSWTTC